MYSSLRIRHHVLVNGFDIWQVAKKVLPVVPDGVIEKSDVLSVAILYVKLVQMLEVVVVQEQELQGGKLLEGNREVLEPVIRQVKFDKVDAFLNGSELRLLHLCPRQDQQL